MNALKKTATNFRYKKLNPLRVVWKSENKLGIENIKQILTIIITFSEDLITILRSFNGFSFAAIPQLATLLINLLRFGNVITLAKEAWLEFKELSQQETLEIIEHIKVEFDIEDDNVELLIERALDFVPRVYELAVSSFTLFSDVQALVIDIRALKEGNIAA